MSGRAFRHVREALETAGWRFEEPTGQGAPLRIRRGRQRLLLEAREASAARRPLLRALLADAILSGRARADRGEEVLALVVAPVISRATAVELEAYAAEVAPGQPFGYADQRGLLRMRGEHLDHVRGEPAHAADAPPDVARPRDPFSDLNQWLLKIVTAAALPRHLIGTPGWTGGSAAELSRLARVSVPAAWRLQSALRASGHLDGAGQAVRVADLLARWRAAVQGPHADFAAAWILAGRSPLERLKRQLSEQPHDDPFACLGLFSACEAMGLGHVRGGPTHLYVRRSELHQLEHLGLVPAEQGQPGDVIVRVARWPEALLRAVVRPDGVPVADVLQCWLDVAGHPARGAEQAAFLWKRVLGPALGGGPQL